MIAGFLWLVFLSAFNAAFAATTEEKVWRGINTALAVLTALASIYLLVSPPAPVA